MVNENPTSLNAIPERFSSVEIPNSVYKEPFKSVFKPLSKDSWMASAFKYKSLSPMNAEANPVGDITNTANGTKRRHSKRASTNSNSVSPYKSDPNAAHFNSAL
jgi:hypothetical protein